MGQFNDRVALITGSGSGIGRATAKAFAEQGADIAVFDINPAGAQETADAIKALGRQCGAWTVDVSDVNALQSAVADAEAQFGHIDILINNAGVPSDRCSIEAVTEEMFVNSFGVHVKGTLFATQAVVPGMKERCFGKIVNISSIQAMGAFANGATYNGAKGAVLAMAKGWAKEFAEWKINVNVVAPGHCLTPMPLSKDSPEVIEQKAQTIPFKRYGQPEDMANAIVFLCSEQANFITGQVISPNGGFTIVGV